MISIQTISNKLCCLTVSVVWNLGMTLTPTGPVKMLVVVTGRLHLTIGCTSQWFLLMPDKPVLATGRGCSLPITCPSPQCRWRGCRADGRVEGPHPTYTTRYPSHPSHGAVPGSLQHGSWLCYSKYMQAWSHVFMSSPRHHVCNILWVTEVSSAQGGDHTRCEGQRKASSTGRHPGGWLATTPCLRMSRYSVVWLGNSPHGACTLQGGLQDAGGHCAHAR